MDTPMAWHITQWESKYERWETRKTDYMNWYSKSTKLVGLGIGRTLAHPNNVRLLGTWNLIEVLASQSAMRDRGWLVRNGQPLSAEDMSALIPNVSAAVFQEALEHFSQPGINWLEKRPWPPAPEDTRNSRTKSPDDFRQSAGEPEDTRNSRTKSPDDLPEAAKNGGGPGTHPAKRCVQTDRQTDSVQTDRQTGVKKNRGGDAVSSRTQFAALRAEIQEMEARKDDLEAEERKGLRQKQRQLRELQARQARGDFTPLEGAS